MFQKYVLVSANNEKLDTYIQVAMDAFDKLTLFINPEAYRAMKSVEKTGALPNQTINADYEMHNRSAAITGSPKLSNDMLSAINKIYKDGSITLDDATYVDFNSSSDELGD